MSIFGQEPIVDGNKYWHFGEEKEHTLTDRWLHFAVTDFKRPQMGNGWFIDMDILVSCFY